MKYRLGNICKIGDGLHGTPNYCKNNEFYFINGNNLKGELIDLSNARSVSKAEYLKYNPNLIPQKTVLLSINGTLGNTAIYNGESIILSKSVAFFECSTDIITPEYLKLYFESCNFQNILNNMATGTTIKNVGLKSLRSLMIDLPSINIQREIVNIIKPFENKLYLNNQINDNLVELVDSYFINFLNNVTTVEKTIEDIGTVVGGGTPSKKIAAYWNGDIAWVTPKDLSQHPLIFTSSGENYITGLGLAKGSAKLLPTNTILFSSRAPIGYISIAKNNLATNQGFKSVIPNKEYSFQFIYELLKHETAAIKNEANGSTFKEISGKKLKQHIINIPNSEDTSKFNEITKPIFKQLRKLEEENEKLLAIKKELLEKYF